MKQCLKPWIVGAAITAAFLCAGPTLDGNDLDAETVVADVR